MPKKCEGCGKKQAHFGLPGRKASHCAACKSDGMVDVKSKMCEGCGKKQPHFGLPGRKASHCTACKSDGMVDVKAKMCRHNEACADHAAGLCSARGNPRYRGYCTHCFAHLFPTDPLTFQIRCKTKETAVRDFLNIRFPELGFIHDKPLYTGGCDCTHRRRIDHRTLVEGTLLCVETDEHQHRGYCPQDEVARYNDLFMVHAGKWVFIRFNPDPYTDARGKRRNPTIATRLRRLAQEVEHAVEEIRAGNGEVVGQMVRIVHLFYDGRPM